MSLRSSRSETSAGSLRFLRSLPRYVASHCMTNAIARRTRGDARRGLFEKGHHSVFLAAGLFLVADRGRPRPTSNSACRHHGRKRERGLRRRDRSRLPLLAQDTEYYTVTDELWAVAGIAPNGGMLCLACLERPIGRELEPARFHTVVPAAWAEHVAARQMKRRNRFPRSPTRRGAPEPGRLQPAGATQHFLAGIDNRRALQRPITAAR